MEPTTIPDLPVPLIAGGLTQQTGSSTDPVVADSGASVPNTNVNVKFPQAIIAQETLSSTLDTERKRIMAEYSFEQLGAISIGQFSQGASGEIDLTQDGITAKNSNGDTTFAISGKTGDATFKGTVEASGFTIADENGIISLSNFEHQQSQYQQIIASAPTTFTDVLGFALTTTNFSRTKIVLFSLSVVAVLAQVAAGDIAGTLDVAVNIDGTQYLNTRILLGAARTGSDNNNIGVFLTSSVSFSKSLGTGTHTFTVSAKLDDGALSVPLSNMQIQELFGTLDYLVIGN